MVAQCMLVSVLGARQVRRLGAVAGWALCLAIRLGMCCMVWSDGCWVQCVAVHRLGEQWLRAQLCLRACSLLHPKHPVLHNKQPLQLLVSLRAQSLCPSLQHLPSVKLDVAILGQHLRRCTNGSTACGGLLWLGCLKGRWAVGCSGGQPPFLLHQT